MGFNTEIQQSIVLALESQGGDAVTTLLAQLHALEAVQATIDTQYGEDGNVLKYVAATNQVQAAIVKNTAATKAAIETDEEYLRMQAALAAMEETSRQKREQSAIVLHETTEAMAALIVSTRELAAATEAAAAADRARQDAIMAGILADDARARKSREAADRIIQDNIKEGEARDNATERSIQDAAREAAAREAFIERTNAQLQAQDAEQARLDAQARARTDQKMARDKAALDAIGAAADKAAAIARREAEALEASNAAFDENIRYQRALQEAEERTAAVKRATLDATKREADEIQKVTAAAREAVAARQALANAEDREHDEIEQLNQALVANAQDVGMATRATREQIQALKDLGIIQDSVTARTNSGKGAFGGFATAAEQAADHTKKMGYAAMNFSYLAQDMQYGIGAVANNIGLMTMSLSNAFPKLDTFITKIGVPGGATGLGAGVMLAAVGFDVLYHNWDKVKGAFGESIPPKLIHDMDAVTKYLKEIEDKTYKVAVDYVDIRNAREDLRKLNEEEAAYNRAKGHKSEDKEAASKLLTEGIGGDVDKVIGAVAALSPKSPSKETEDAQAHFDDLNKLYRQQSTSMAPHEMALAPITLIRLNRANDALQAARGADYANQREAAKALVSKMLAGDESARAGVEDLATASPHAARTFAAQGVKPGFADLLKSASPAAIAHNREIDLAYDEANREGEESIKEVKEAHKKIRDKAEKEEKQEEKEDDFARKREREGQERFMKWEAGGRDSKEIEAAKNKVTNAANKNAREVPKARLAALTNQFAGRFQQEYGASEEQANEMGEDAARMVGQGATPQQAFAASAQKMLAEIRKLNMAMLRQQAAIDEANGFFGEAAMILMQLNGKMNGVGAGMARNRNMRQTSQPTFSPY